jgi:hypothetical protein
MGAASKPRRSTRERLRTLAQLAFALAGVAAVVILVRQVGARTLLGMIGAALPWMPALLLLEAVRILADMLGTRALARLAISAHHDDQLDLASWVRMHLVANAALVVLPAGRAICEGIKVMSISAVTGAPRAAGIVVVQHGMTMLALGTISIPCAAAALVLHSKILALLIAGHGVLCFVGAFGFLFASRRANIPRFAATWFVHAPDAISTFRATVKSLPWFSPAAFGAKLLNRVAQTAQYVLLLLAIAGDASAARAFFAEGVNLVGSALGEFIPAQVGTIDGAFAYAAPQLEINLAMAVGIAALARLTQLVWSAVGALVPVIVPRIRRLSRA